VLDPVLFLVYCAADVIAIALRWTQSALICRWHSAIFPRWPLGSGQQSAEAGHMCEWYRPVDVGQSVEIKPGKLSSFGSVHHTNWHKVWVWMITCINHSV